MCSRYCGPPRTVFSALVLHTRFPTWRRAYVTAFARSRWSGTHHRVRRVGDWWVVS